MHLAPVGSDAELYRHDHGQFGHVKCFCEIGTFRGKSNSLSTNVSFYVLSLQ